MPVEGVEVLLCMYAVEGQRGPRTEPPNNKVQMEIKFSLAKVVLTELHTQTTLPTYITIMF